VRILHLFSNWKLTGPAEPVIETCGSLRRAGLDVQLACARAPGKFPMDFERRARAEGLEPLLDLHLDKHLAFLRNLADARALARLLRERRVDLLHAHMTNDHLIGTWAARRAGVPVVRTVHEGDARRLGRRDRFLIRRARAVVAPGAGVARALGRLIEPARVAVIEPAVRLERFDAGRALPEMRKRLGGREGSVLGGVVSRIQARRRYDLILEALRRALPRAPRLHLALVGRGTRAREVGEAAARRLGIGDAVTMPGYFLGDEYVGALRALDFLVYLVPGTDGTCRTVREALATGVPAIVSRRGLLPELVLDGETGLVVDEEPDALAAAMARLAGDEALRRRMSARAAAEARRRFAAGQAAAALAALYARV